MIVLDLRCDKDHQFEGWFGSAEAFESQLARRLVTCPVCASASVRRLPSAPYVQTRQNAPAAAPLPKQTAPAGAKTPVETPGAAVAPKAVAAVMSMLRKMAREAEDVGERLPEEARRIHYGESEARTIRGAASREEIGELRDEGIMLMPVLPSEDDLH